MTMRTLDFMNRSMSFEIQKPLHLLYISILLKIICHFTAGISSVPIADENGFFLDVYSRRYSSLVKIFLFFDQDINRWELVFLFSDITTLANGDAYAQIQLDQTIMLQVSLSGTLMLASGLFFFFFFFSLICSTVLCTSLYRVTNVKDYILVLWFDKPVDCFLQLLEDVPFMF